VTWGHGYQDGPELRNRKEFLEEAVAMASSSLISLRIDCPIARPGYVEPKDELDESQIADRVQTILDLRRGADLLWSRDDVEAKRLACAGHSYYGAAGAFLAGIDKRVKAFVLAAGTLSDEVDMKSKEFQDFRKRMGAEKVDGFIAKYSWLDQGKYVSQAAPASVFL
jgi:hypothetical protein